MGQLPTFLLNGRRSDLDVDLPLSLCDDKAGAPSDPTAVADWCLYRYLGEGGLRAFASSSLRLMVRQRQVRFFWVAGFLLVLWLVFRYV